MAVPTSVQAKRDIAPGPPQWCRPPAARRNPGDGGALGMRNMSGSLQRMKGSSFKFGATEDELSNDGWFEGARSTVFATLIDEEGNSGTFKNLKTKKYGLEHAEDVWIRTLQENATEGKYSYNGINEVFLNVTASPCTSVSRNGLPETSKKLVGCTEELIAVAQGGLIGKYGFTYYFAMTVIAHHLYQPKGFGGGVKDASKEAITALREAGVKCAVESEDDFYEEEE